MINWLRHRFNLQKYDLRQTNEVIMMQYAILMP
jgi:hypothetical protein